MYDTKPFLEEFNLLLGEDPALPALAVLYTSNR